MKNKLYTLIKSLTLFSLAFVMVRFSFAAGLELHSIGALETQGNNYPEWWYVGSSPTLSGVADPGSAITIKIGDDSYSVVPEDSGTWSYPTSLEDADHTIVISQGDTTLSFVLHLGQTMPATTGIDNTSESTASVPETGFNQYVALAFGSGVILLATYFYFASESNGKKVFETRMLKED